MNTPTSTKLKQNNMKAIIGQSYNKLYSEFQSNELNEVGNYKILNQIGEGSFGKVYLALHRPTHRKVVIKTSDKKDPNIVREVFYHRQFDYPYITKLYEVIATENKVWMALEYCPRKELYDYLLSKKRIPPMECIQLFSQIVGAVHYAHSLNCVHRDLKLENILLDKHGNAKLTDFGFTRECMSKTTLETICGTTVYMAPELTERKNYDGFKIDVWALGIILYTLIRGTMPFDDDDETRTKWKIVNEMPNFDDDIIDENLRDLLTRLLSKDPMKRPSTQQILEHDFLQPYGRVTLDKTDKIINKQKMGSNNFHSKSERRLLRRLKNTGFDTQAIKHSVTKKKCDSLSATWLLLLEKERKSEKQGYQRKNRSLLSMKKVIGNSISAGSDHLYADDGILKNSIELSKVTSISKVITKTTDVGLSITPLATKLVKEQSKIQPTRSSGPQKTHYDSRSSLPSHTSDISRSTIPKKNGLLRKMTDFFKIRRHSDLGHDLNGSPENFSNDSPSRSFSTSFRQWNNISPKKSSSISQKDTKTFSSTHSSGATSKSEKNLKYNNPQEEKESSEKILSDEPQIKRLKSTISSDNTSHRTSIYDSESFNNTPLPPNDIKRSSSPRLQSRPLSSISQISNETYTSDYSTDGTTSFFQGLENSKSSMASNAVNHNYSQHSSSEKVLSSSKKVLTRNISIRSENSSTSERSSRTDSFYDITTSSPPMAFDSRNTIRSNLKESVLPRFGTQPVWPAKRTYSSGRRGYSNRRRLNKKSNFLKNGSVDSVNIIKEESSSNEESHSDIKNSAPEFSVDEEEGSQIEKLIPHTRRTQSIKAVTVGAVKTTSAGSEWSASEDELKLQRQIDDDEFVAAADLEDNFTDGELDDK